MQHSTTRVFTRTALAATLLAIGAGTSFSALAAKTPMQKVSVRFVATVGDKLVSCNRTLKGMGTTGVDARLRDLRLYVANIALTKVVDGVETLVPITLNANDSQLTAAGNTVALVDLENGNAATGGYCAGTSALNASIVGKGAPGHLHRHGADPGRSGGTEPQPGHPPPRRRSTCPT